MGSKQDRLIKVKEYFEEASLDAAKSALALGRSIIRKRELAIMAMPGQPVDSSPSRRLPGMDTVRPGTGPVGQED